MENPEFYMKKALELAQEAYNLGEVPVGAVVVHEGKIVGQGFNQRETKKNPLLHAEMIALAEASEKLGRWRLHDCQMYVTLEPCPMCAGALVNARLEHLIYGASDPKAGAVQSLFKLVSDPRLNHRAAVTSGLLQEDCTHILKKFFLELRQRPDQTI